MGVDPETVTMQIILICSLIYGRKMIWPGKIWYQGITGSVKECALRLTQVQASAPRNGSILSVCTDESSLQLHRLEVYYQGSAKMDV
jgi:hypothetical protein